MDRHATALDPSGQLHYFVHHFTADLLGEDTEPDLVAELWLPPRSADARRAVAVAGGQAATAD
jgi:hypothetical protein